MFNGNHDLSVLDCVELFESVELELSLILLVNIESFQHGTALVLESKSNILAEPVFPITSILTIIHFILVGCFHGDHEWFSVDLRVVVIV